MQNHKKFFFVLIIFSAAVYFLFRFLQPSIPERFYFKDYWWLVLFFAAATTVFHTGLIRNFNKSHREVVRYYMMATAVKLFVYIGLFVGYALINRPQSLPFIITFFLLYILFTVFEVVIAYNTLRQKPPANASDVKQDAL